MVTWIRHLGHPEGAAALCVEDEIGEFAGQIQVKAFSGEDEFASGGYEDRSFVGGEDLLG